MAQVLNKYTILTRVDKAIKPIGEVIFRVLQAHKTTSKASETEGSSQKPLRIVDKTSCFLPFCIKNSIFFIKSITLRLEGIELSTPPKTAHFKVKEQHS